MRWLVMAALLVSSTGAHAKAAEKSLLVIYEGKKTILDSARVTSSGLWVNTRDLSAATGYHIKPQGVCRDELCFPIPSKRKAQFIVKQGGVTWFNLSEFATLINQPAAKDEKNGVWYFGTRNEAHETYLGSLEAPDFTLPDQNGKRHSLSEFKGKKVLLVTWASW
jgi:hypothetical protein